MIPEAVRVGADEAPWVENLAYPGTMMRLLRADREEGTWKVVHRHGDPYRSD